MFTIQEQRAIYKAKKIIESKMKDRTIAFTAAHMAVDYLKMAIGTLEHEVFHVLYLDNQNKLIEAKDMFTGTIDGASVYPREVVKKAMQCNAAAVILGHNHPSGEVAPSEADIRITRRLKEALELVDVRVLDHIIVGGAKSFSFAQERMI